MNAIAAVFIKEIRENLRDKRTIMSALLYGPLIGPAMFVLMMFAISSQLGGARSPVDIPVIGANRAPTLVTELKQAGLVPQPSTASPMAMVESHMARVVLRIPSTYAAQWKAGRPATVELFYDSSQRGVQSTIARVKGMLEAWSRKQGALRLLARGISPTVITPLVIADRDQSTPMSRAGLFLAFMPYFFVIVLFTGGMYLANDLTAGERERQSLEPLFASPVARWRILLGKLGAVCVFALASLVICLVLTLVAARIVPMPALDIAVNLGVRFGALTLLLMLPLASLIAVVQTLVAAFAKSYREAQTYLQFMMIVLVIPSVVMSFMPMNVRDWVYLIPVMGQQIGITQLLGGAMPSGLEIVYCLAGSGVATLVAGVITVWVYRSERLAISA
ncbi:MAG TPA: ABC transporter permease [Rhodanobacteraceae bacterium]